MNPKERLDEIKEKMHSIENSMHIILEIGTDKEQIMFAVYDSAETWLALNIEKKAIEETLEGIAEMR